MSDYHVEELGAVVTALRNKKRLKRHGGVVTLELLDLGLGFYQFPDGDDVQLEKVATYERLAELKNTHGDLLVKLQKHQVQAFADYLAKQSEPLYKVGFDALADVKSKKDLGFMTVEMEAALAVAAEFQVSWDKGVVAEAKLQAGVKIKMDGKYAVFSAGASIAIQAKAQLHINKVALEVSASAEVEANLKTQPMKIGDTSYSVAFYTEWKAYAKAEAKFEAELEFSKTNFLNAKAKGRLFAGVGVSGEIGVELNGKFTANGNPNTRLLAKLNLNAAVEAGALLSFGADFGSATEETIGGALFIKKTFNTELGLGIGASVTVNVLLLKEISDTIQEKIIQELKELVAKLIGDDMIEYLEKKYAGFKKKATNIAHYIGNAIYTQFSSESYKALYLTMDSSIRRLENHIENLEKNPESLKAAQKAKARLAKVEKQMLKYQAKIEGVRTDCGDALSAVAELLAVGDLDKKTFITRSSKLLNAVDEAKDQVASMIAAIENVTMVSLEMIDIENMLDDSLIDEDLMTSKDPLLLERRQKMNSLLDSQQFLHDSLDYITDELKELLVAEMQKRD